MKTTDGKWLAESSAGRQVTEVTIGGECEFAHIVRLWEVGKESTLTMMPFRFGEELNWLIEALEQARHEFMLKRLRK
jgi:hypothetical protein